MFKPLASYRSFVVACLLCGAWTATAQRNAEQLPAPVLERLLEQGFAAQDLGDLVVTDDYTSSGLRHTFYRQRWQGIDVWNGDIAVHTGADGSILKLNVGAVPHLAKGVNATDPAIDARTALSTVLARTAPGVSMPALIENDRHAYLFDGTALGDEPVRVHLVYCAGADGLRLAWNVNHYTPDGSHWWNVRIDALTGAELDRNDWVSQCGFDHPHALGECPAPSGMAAPAAPNDYRVYPAPVESPSHGARAIRNAPWTAAGIASPYGWHDTNGAAGAEYTYTRGNNVLAQEDANGNNGNGVRPTSATLDFDYPINLANAPSTYQNAATTNLFYWNNLMHDVWYQYGFDDPSGNFQQNNYGRGGTGNDYVLADSQDGGGTDNANFATPPEGTSPRMQMYLWTYTTPGRDGDLDNGIIAHEYTHGISTRLVGGPSNSNCLNNAEQMGEGWSDWFALMMTIEPGDQGTDRRGIGTYVIGQGTNGGGIRPAPYSTSFAQNNYTYASTNNTALAAPHGVGFVWCTILWEMTWELIATDGFDPDLYFGTGGNNIAMRLVVEGMKLTPCNPGFVDARDAILQADQNLYGGAHSGALWTAFARRGLGVSASQGNSNSRTDQTEAFNTPMPNNIGVAQILSPAPGNLGDCGGAPITVRAIIRNYGSVAQSNFPVRYQLDGGALVSQNYTGSLASGAQATITFTVPVSITGLGAHTLMVSTALAGDTYPTNDQVTNAINVVATTTVNIPFTEGLSAAPPAPPGWTLENPDALTTWSTANIANGPACGASRVWYMDNYNYNGVGEEDRLVTPLLSLVGATGSFLQFEHAYAPYGPGYYDSFRVDVSGNCGGNWTQVYYATGVGLATTAANTGAWAPTNCSQWQPHTIDISAFDGQLAMVRFVGINGYGNYLYLDDVAVGAAVLLPVELVDLRANTQRDGIMLTWSTASEINTDRFDVERSTDGIRWNYIGTREAAGTSAGLLEYGLLDEAPVNGTNYYRLRMIDRDATQEFSPTVTADWNSTGPDIHPNPSTGAFYVTAPADATIEVLDAFGRSVPHSRTPKADGTVYITLLRPATGTYLLRIQQRSTVITERVVITGR